jgi:hypothetical protein
VRVLTTRCGARFKVSDEDAPHLGGFRWHLTNRRVASSRRSGSRVEVVYAARLISGARTGQRVALRNGDPLDLRRSNLVLLGQPR